MIHLAQDVVQGIAQGGAGGRDMFKGGRGNHAGILFELFHQLPAVEGIQKVDIAGLAVQYVNRQIAAVRHKDPGRLLVGVAAVFKC